jgi:glycosyltransferase involved in cell wall biosynthesis
MKINFTLWSAELQGGVRAVFEIANKLSERGHSVDIVALGGNHAWFPLEAKINYVKPPSILRILNPVFVDGHRRFIVLRAFLLLLAKLEARFGIDLTGRGLAVSALSRAIPDCDANVATWYPTALAVRSSGKGQPFYYMQDFWEQSGLDRKLFHSTLELPMYFLTNSEYTKRIVLGVQPTAKVEVVGAGVNLEVFYPRKKKIVNSHGLPIVMVIVRKEPIKQADLAIEVLNQVNEVTPICAILVGEIPKNARIDFHFISYKGVSDSELAELYSTSDLFLFTSSIEGFALPPLEAMACGTPVVTTDCKGNRDYAIDGFNCLISPPDDKRQLVSQIANVRFTWDRVVDRFETAVKQNA